MVKKILNNKIHVSEYQSFSLRFIKLSIKAEIIDIFTFNGNMKSLILKWLSRSKFELKRLQVIFFELKL